MKKCWVLIILMLFVLLLTACGTHSKQREDLYGTWKVVSVEYEGSKFTVDEWKVMEEEDLSENYIILKEGGKAFVYEDDYGYLEDWMTSEERLIIGGEMCMREDEFITMDYYGNTLYFQKISDSQTIPSEQEVDLKSDCESVDCYDEESAEEKNTSSSTKESTTHTQNTSASRTKTTQGVAWKQFLKEYEEWVDDYIDIMEKYKADPTDISILAEYTEVLSEMADWTQRADDIELELEDPEDALEYSAELLRISNKLAHIAY